MYLKKLFEIFLSKLGESMSVAYHFPYQWRTYNSVFSEGMKGDEEYNSYSEADPGPRIK